MSGKELSGHCIVRGCGWSPLDDVLSTATHFVLLPPAQKDDVLYGLEPLDRQGAAVMDYAKIVSAAARADSRPSGILKIFDIATEMKDCISLGDGASQFKNALDGARRGASCGHGKGRT